MDEKEEKNVFVFNGNVNQVGSHIGTQYFGCNIVQNYPAARDDAQNDARDDGKDAAAGDESLTVSVSQGEEEARGAAAAEMRDERISHAFGILRNEGLLRFAYDYVWVMLVMNQSADMPDFVSPQHFLCYLSDTLHLDKLPSESTISKKVKDTRNEHPHWTFADTADATEVRRRNNVASRFLSAARKG